MMHYIIAYHWLLVLWIIFIDSNEGFFVKLTMSQNEKQWWMVVVVALVVHVIK